MNHLIKNVSMFCGISALDALLYVQFNASIKAVCHHMFKRCEKGIAEMVFGLDQMHTNAFWVPSRGKYKFPNSFPNGRAFGIEIMEGICYNCRGL